MSPTKRQALVLVLLVSIDAALKLAASLVLASGQPVPEECVLCIVLRVNPLGLGSNVQSILASEGPRPLVMGLIYTVSLATFLVVLAIAGRVTKSWVAAIAISAIIPSLSLPVLFPRLTLLPLTTIAAATRIAQSIFWLVIWALLRSSFWKIGTLLFSAASISNTLSLFYPPYGVVDYLWSSPLHRLIGFGVFNIADIFWLTAFPIFAIALVRAIVLALRNPKENLTNMGA